MFQERADIHIKRPVEELLSLFMCISGESADAILRVVKIQTNVMPAGAP